MIDSTDVAANVNYPSEKKLLCNAFRKVIKEIDNFNPTLASQQLQSFEADIEQEYNQNDKVSIKKYLKIADRHLGYIYLKTYDQLQINQRYNEAFGILHDIIYQYSNDTKDKIVSCVDPDARIAHKSPGNIKKGYKDHIIVDEDSEIILSSIQTPFNVGDEKVLCGLVDKVSVNLELKPEEISADKVYGTIDNRVFLKDNDMTANISFYNESNRKLAVFGIKDFNISEDLKTVTCPNGITTNKYSVIRDKSNDKEDYHFRFDKKVCLKCPHVEQCLRKNKNGKYLVRKVEISSRYDVVLDGLKRNQTVAFQEAINKRYKVERRFATMVRNHGLRRCRFLKLAGAKIHITLANMACNIVRMVNLLTPSSFAMS